MAKTRRQKITKHTIPEDFSLSLALFDLLPVLLFGGSVILIGILYRSPLFLIGAVLVLWAGIAKVLWKIIAASKKKNIWWLFMQMRIAMPIGFVLILLSLFFSPNPPDLTVILSAVTAFPPVLFFLFGLLAMILMGVFSVKLDSGDVRSNWIEEITNTLAQLSIFTGVLLCLLHTAG